MCQTIKSAWQLKNVQSVSVGTMRVEGNIHQCDTQSEVEKAIMSMSTNAFF